MKKTQINKKTEHHIGLLKAKLARLREELESSTSKGGGPPLRISKAGPPPLEVELSSSSRNRASFALRRPIWCSVFLLIWVFFISSSICLIFSGRPNLLYLWFPVCLRPDIVNLASRSERTISWRKNRLNSRDLNDFALEYGFFSPWIEYKQGEEYLE